MPSGIVIVDKPEGWTSMDVCARLRGVLREKRVGHGGTLDPMATGVLPVFVGTATRAAALSEQGDKEYIALLRLGVETDTQDVTGRTLAEREVSVTRDELVSVLARFTGAIEQVPPMYSAVRRDGKRLYELARKGVEVERAPRPVTVYALELLSWPAAGEDIPLRVRCSRGTYVRTLCHDVGRALGCGGCMAGLRRTAAAGFTLADAVTLEDIQERGASLLRPVDSLFADRPAYGIPTERLERLCRNGAALPVPDLRPGEYRVYGRDGAFLCLSRWERGRLVSVRNFFTS